MLRRVVACLCVCGGGCLGFFFISNSKLESLKRDSTQHLTLLYRWISKGRKEQPGSCLQPIAIKPHESKITWEALTAITSTLWKLLWTQREVGERGEDPLLGSDEPPWSERWVVGSRSGCLLAHSLVAQVLLGAGGCCLCPPGEPACPRSWAEEAWLQQALNKLCSRFMRCWKLAKRSWRENRAIFL